MDDSSMKNTKRGLETENLLSKALYPSIDMAFRVNSKYVAYISC